MPGNGLISASILIFFMSQVFASNSVMGSSAFHHDSIDRKLAAKAGLRVLAAKRKDNGFIRFGKRDMLQVSTG